VVYYYVTIFIVSRPITDPQTKLMNGITFGILRLITSLADAVLAKRTG